MSFLPFELLKENINKKVKIHLKKDKTFEGVLSEFDQHGNIFLENCYEKIADGCTVFLGNTLINSGSIAMIDIE